MPSALTVFTFSKANQAEEALASLDDLRKQQVIDIADSVVVTWPEGRKAPRTIQSIKTAGIGALGGTFWGMLVGTLFMMPLLGAAIGAAAGAVGGALTDIGIDDSFIASVRERVKPGTSALFLMADTQAPDKVAEQLRRFDPEVLTTNLSYEQEQRLRELFEEA